MVLPTSIRAALCIVVLGAASASGAGSQVPSAPAQKEEPPAEKQEFLAPRPDPSAEKQEPLVPLAAQPEPAPGKTSDTPPDSMTTEMVREAPPAESSVPVPDATGPVEPGAGAPAPEPAADPARDAAAAPPDPAPTRPRAVARPADTPGAAPTSAGVQDGGLPRRPRVGLTFSPVADGLAVAGVAPRSPAALAGISEGDVLLAINDVPIRDVGTLAARMRFVRPGESVRMAVMRSGQPLEITLVPEEAVREGDLNAKVEYGAVNGSAGRLRTVTSFPKGGGSAPRPVVVIVRGVGASPADAPGNNAIRDLAFQFARAGIIAVRYDPQGVGDSDGPPNASVDFKSETADVLAIVEAIRNDARVDPDQVFLFGHGTGGGVAATAAVADGACAGVILVGTIARPLMEYLLESRRQQMTLAGLPPAEIDDLVRKHISIFATMLATGVAPKPDPDGIVAPDGTVLGKSAPYWQQYDAVNFGKILKDLQIPVLNALGEYDFVSTSGDHRAIADALRARGDKGDVFLPLSRTDHDFRSFESRSAAFAAFGSTGYPVNSRALSPIVEWVRARVTRAGAGTARPTE